MNYKGLCHTHKDYVFQFKVHTWPCPREIAVSFLENLISSANLYRSAAGSVPVERTKMSGVDGDESLKTEESSAVW